MWLTRAMGLVCLLCILSVMTGITPDGWQASPMEENLHTVFLVMSGILVLRESGLVGRAACRVRSR